MTAIMRRVRARAARRQRDQRGFTLTEVVVVVVVMGLVVAPLALAVTQALKLTPDAGARTQVATDGTLLADRFSADIANTNYNGGGVVTGGTGAFTTRNVTCGETTPPAAFVIPENGWIVLTTDTALKSTAPIVVAYSVVWTQVTGGYKFVLNRAYIPFNSTSWSPAKAMLTGYCKTGERVATLTNEAKGTDGRATRRVTMSVFLRRSISSDPTNVVVTASVRNSGV